jgi:rhodanese-related sulfurtransferase
MRTTCQYSPAVLLVAAALALAGCNGGAGGSGGEVTSGVAGTVTRAALGHIDAVSTRTLVAGNPGVLLLDVRQPEELTGELGQIEGVTLIPLPELPARLVEIGGWKDKTVITVCRSGNRSQTAGDILLKAGFKDVRNLDGGMIAWRQTEGVARP